MGNKKAFVCDTNFIKKHINNLKEIIEELNGEFSVYITQLSIEERKGQRCREDKQAYEELENKGKKYRFFANVEFKYNIDELCKIHTEAIQANYERLFNNNIIPINYSSKMLEDVLKRACDKLPPFSNDKNASDKGFKDYLLWSSIISYFKTKGENEVLFLTDDKGFLDNIEWLKNEFFELTNKAIEIKSNDYYKELIDDNDIEINIETEDVLEIANIHELRDEIENVFYAICNTEVEDYLGLPDIERTYISHILFSTEDTVRALNRLPFVISKHVFEKRISVYDVFDIRPGDIIGNHSVDIEDLENVVKLYKKIKEKYSDYLEQFITVVTKILNSNYEPIIEDDDDLPF